MVIYFISLQILKSDNNFKKFIITSVQFAVFSLLAGGLSALVLLPEIYALKLTASGDFNFPTTFESYFSIFDMIARHMGNVQIEIGLDHWPNIYCGNTLFVEQKNRQKGKGGVYYIACILPCRIFHKCT